MNKEQQDQQTPSRVYTEEEIASLLQSYIIVHRSLWDHIPIGSHIRYLKKQKPGENKPIGERFKPGGFVKTHFTKNDKKFLLVGSQLSKKSLAAGKKVPTFPIAYEDIEVLWKKYDRATFVEISLMHNSLAKKDMQIKELTRRVEQLERQIKELARGSSPPQF